MNLIELTRALIDIPSNSGEEGAVGDFLFSYLDGLGYRVERQEVAAGRFNILAAPGDTRPRVTLSTHMDTVPPHISSSEDEQYVYGRGACDAKGIIAAQIAATERLRAEGESAPGLLFTVDEEMGSLGARAANEHPHGRASRFLVNGEPTDNKLAIGSKGSLRLVIKTEGRAAHSAYPEHGESAIEKLLDVLALLRACRWPTDDFFGETTCNVGRIGGGTRPNVIPAEAQAELQIRLVTDAAPVRQIIEEAVAGRARIEYLSVADPVRMLAVDGFEQCIVRFTTDIPHLKNWGAPLLVGPGSILLAHTARERVAKRELSEAVEIYAGLVRSLIARAAEDEAMVEEAR
ncbi:MAG TPA: M20/M25/M40 family metallo-hydrolase [Pyrinomonadaceae bacterium]|nr:M20/M25/M40 family metallo-hydrolase [Pyrinomonadaceae bacterium]